VSIRVAPGQSFEAQWQHLATGLVGTAGVRIDDGQGATVLARTTSGIIESPAGSGIYTATGLVAPSTAGQYWVVWDAGSFSPGLVASEELVVTATAFSPTIPSTPTSYTAQEIVDAALKMSRRPPQTQNRADALFYLNEIYTSLLSGETDYSFLEVSGTHTLSAGTTVVNLNGGAGTLQANLGAPVQRVLALRNNSEPWPPLRQFSDRMELDRWAGGSVDQPVVTGTPVAWTHINDSQLLVWPTPDQAVTLGVVAKIQVVRVALTDGLLIPAAWQARILVPYIASKMWAQFSGGEARNESAFHMRDFESARREFDQTFAAAPAQSVSLWWGGNEWEGYFG